MIAWPDLGTRVTVRYRRPAGSVPPLTDAPVRTAHIRGLEHAAAFAWPGVEQHWLDRWLLRAGHGVTFRANSAVPLDISANANAIPAITAWYTQRGLTPRLAIPDRLSPLPAGLPGERTYRVLVRDVSTCEPDPSVVLAPRPDDAWLRLYHRDVPLDVLTAVVDGELMFGTSAGMAVGRAAVTDAPDGTRWVGLSSVRTADEPQGAAPVRRMCETLLAWGADRGATSGYVRVSDENTAAAQLFESLGFSLHHRSRYVSVRST